MDNDAALLLISHLSRESISIDVLSSFEKLNFLVFRELLKA